MDKKRLSSYASLIVNKGLCIMPGQKVIVRSALEQIEFVETVVEECYKAGASKVTVDWHHDPITKLDIKYQAPEVLGETEAWEKLRFKIRTGELPADIYLDSDDPDAFAGIDNEKWANAKRNKYKVRKRYLDMMENKYQWCVAAVPGKKWAMKVYPDLPEEEAIERLWEEILICARADSDDPQKQWDEHNANLKKRCDWLNGLHLTRLVYKSEMSGTDFSVGLIDKMRFMGGLDELETDKGRANNVFYNANIPSEEVFTTPMKGDCEGVLVATRPLSYRGVLIEDFSIWFKNGKVTKVKAAKNEDALRTMISMDKGASMLGECALVPYHSPISQSGILFYSTLLDENASCHMALGDGYSSCLENAGSYTPAEARRIGVNNSMIHEDFMVGTPDLSITGITKDGKEVQIFKNGDWAD